MKFFLDENMNYGCLAPLREIYREHEFRHIHDEGMSGEQDIPLFARLREQKYDALLTKDRNQLTDEAERRALFDSGLHWVGHVSKGFQGLKGITMETATVTAGLIYVLEDWRAEPYSYQLKGIPSEIGQRVKVRAVALDGWRRPRRGGLGIA
ncbi:hypothetical protein [Tsukamurella pseudospumae]|uniref:VapC45 PIN like domain-containing protein n=1 Tax=Tsukamurella pseudospumae TaxID=239498 RepID=A0A138AE98_9ACTN|nr:hypothetical protein [Tsukamurella pseudospumae]KXP08831.1 hypothetical protein AXK60_09215 [Tsukamurella pseudospumae]